MLKKLALGFILLTITSLCGCNNVGYRDYKELEQETQLGLGLNYTELEDMLIEFAYKVYMPRSEEDIQNGIELLKDIATDKEIASLKSIAGTYNKDSTQKVTKVDVIYTNGKNNTDHMEHIYIEIGIENNGLKTQMIEFVVNPNNKIFQHKIYDSFISQ